MYPFLLGHSCSIGKIQKTEDGQEFDTVMERLLFLKDGGIVGAIAPTSGTLHQANEYLADLIFSHFLYGTNRAVGEELKQIKFEFLRCEYMYSNRWQSVSTLLYGDPSSSLPIIQYANRAHPVYDKINPNFTT